MTTRIKTRIGAVACLALLAFFTDCQCPKNQAKVYPAKFSVCFEGSKLVILDQPHDQFVRLGTNASFSVTATSSPPSLITYQWQFNSNTITNATNSLLTITSAQ